MSNTAPHKSYLYVEIEGEWQLAMNPSQYKQKKHSGVTLETIGIRDGKIIIIVVVLIIFFIFFVNSGFTLATIGIRDVCFDDNKLFLYYHSQFYFIIKYSN